MFRSSALTPSDLLVGKNRCLITYDAYRAFTRLGTNGSYYAPRAIQITGPNGSGKSFILKSIYRIFALTDPGSYWPESPETTRDQISFEIKNDSTLRRLWLWVDPEHGSALDQLARQIDGHTTILQSVVAAQQSALSKCSNLLLQLTSFGSTVAPIVASATKDTSPSIVELAELTASLLTAVMGMTDGMKLINELGDYSDVLNMNSGDIVSLDEASQTAGSIEGIGRALRLISSVIPVVIAIDGGNSEILQDVTDAIASETSNVMIIATSTKEDTHPYLRSFAANEILQLQIEPMSTDELIAFSALTIARHPNIDLPTSFVACAIEDANGNPGQLFNRLDSFVQDPSDSHSSIHSCLTTSPDTEQRVSATQSALQNEGEIPLENTAVIRASDTLFSQFMHLDEALGAIAEDLTEAPDLESIICLEEERAFLNMGSAADCPYPALALSYWAAAADHLRTITKLLRRARRESECPPERLDLTLEATRWNQLSFCLFKARKLDGKGGAISASASALTMSSQAHGKSADITLERAVCIIGLLLKAERFAVALSRSTQLMNICDENDAISTDLRLMIQSLYGESIGHCGDAHRATVILEDVLRKRTRLHGEMSFPTSITMGNLAAWIAADGDPQRALTLCRTAYDIRQHILPAEHPRMITISTSLATRAMDAKEYSLAASLFEKLLSLPEAVARNADVDRGYWRLNFALCIAKMGGADMGIQRLRSEIFNEQHSPFPDWGWIDRAQSLIAELRRGN